MSFTPKYNASDPTLTEGQFNTGRVDVNGKLLVSSSSTISSALPAGNNNIGDVDVASIAAGSNIIGNIRIDQTTPGTTNGVVVNRQPTSTAAITSVASSTSSVTLLASNTARKGASIQNTSTAILYVLLSSGTATATTSHSVQMASGTYYEIPFGYTGAITGIWASANGQANMTEFT